MKTELKFSDAAGVETELLVVFAIDHSTSKDKDVKPELALLTSESAVTAAAESVLTTGEFKATANETLLLHHPVGLSAKRLLLVGLGKASKVNVHDVRRGAGTAVRFAKPRTIREVTIAVPDYELLPPGPCVRAIVEGAMIADFDPDVYRSDRKDQSLHTVQLLAPPPDTSDEKSIAELALQEGTVLAESQNWTRSLVNEPGNVLPPSVLGQRAAEMAKEVGLKCEVYSTEKLHELKMGAFWAVAQGSDQPPALIVTTYEPEGALEDGPVLGLVGKAITFDTGGISIKPSEGMEKMKYDMAGGAAMLGAMRAIALLKPKVKVISVVCSAENMPSGKAYRPGDVVTAMSGKTIEVMNTDAEGRMVLADGLHYAKQLGVTHLINAATLTGACVVALGMVNAGIFSNDDESYGHFVEALKISGDKFWRLPEEDEYREQIKSQIADIMNTGGSRWGGATTAAMFLKEFVGETPWIHLDIAGVAWLEEQKPWIAKGPTGTPVRSLVEWVRSYAAVS
jgi:leucyl aminopeptidase